MKRHRLCCWSCRASTRGTLAENRKFCKEIKTAKRHRVCSESTRAMFCLVENFVESKRLKRNTKVFLHDASRQTSCITVMKTWAVNWFRCFHDYKWSKHKSVQHKRHTLRAFWAWSLEPMTIRPGPPMLQKLFRCSPSSTGTVETA